MSRVINSPDVDKVPAEQMPRFLALVLNDIVTQVNGGLDFATNFNAKSVSALFSAVNTDTAIAHGLGRVPVGYLKIGSSVAMTIYDGQTNDTSILLYLKSDAIGTAQLLVF